MATSGGPGTISSPGIGSGLDVNALVKSLMTPATNKLTLLQNQEAAYNTKLSAIGQLQSALSAFQTSLGTLSSAAQFLQVAAAVGDNTILSATADSTANVGQYNINISQLAQAQSLSTSGFANQTSAIGSGTSTKVTITLGTISGGTLTNGTYAGASFTPNAGSTPLNITIDSSNNSLTGIRDAINAQNGDAVATIVNDGSGTPYRLVLTSKTTGQNMSMKVDVAAGGDPAISNLLANDPTGTQNMTQTTAAQNANLTINGLAVTSATNTVTTSVNGLSLTLAKVGSTTVTTSRNTSAVTQAVQSFTAAYNTLQTTIGKLTAFDSTGNGANNGPLIGDSTVQLVQNRLSQILNSKLPGVSSTGLASLAQVGVAFQKDGTLSVDTTALNKAMSSPNGFNALASLFATNGQTTDSLVSFTSATNATQPGQYDINITQAATQGGATGAVTLGVTTTIAAGSNELQLMLDGNVASVLIPPGTYTQDKLAAAIQSAINGNSKFSAASSAVSVTTNNGILTVTSNRYGSASKVSITGGSAFTQLFNGNTMTTGQDVVGTIGGFGATGSGQTLTGNKGTPVEGLKLTVTGSTIGNRGNVGFSQGFASLLTTQVTDFLSAQGAVTNATNNLNTSLKQIKQQESDWQDQMTQMQNRYLAQFTALDATMAKLQNTSDYLKQVLGGSSSSSSK
ncbi:flagellar filament capping protein FliD [Pandoraea sp. NPDC087047]|uniref:flagellar filament capping protein FliD n=1 Tax=Pandoraea sp. NPDC087047 TaxID=3364390 RepID=UPI0037FE6C24